jgi:hypothetical protein
MMSHIPTRVPEMKPAKGILVDDKRLTLHIEEIRGHFATLFETISGARAHFVLNMSEMGHQTCADAPSKKF